MHYDVTLLCWICVQKIAWFDHYYHLFYQFKRQTYHTHYHNKLQYYFPFKGLNFEPKEDRSNTEPFFYGVKGFHPFTLFKSEEDLHAATNYCLSNHILSCHEYCSWYKRKAIAKLYHEDIKSVFDDTFTRENIKQNIMETIKNPTYVVRQDFDRPERYIVMKR